MLFRLELLHRHFAWAYILEPLHALQDKLSRRCIGALTRHFYPPRMVEKRLWVADKNV